MKYQLIIICLIILVIYLYYQQNQPNLLANSENQAQIRNLQQEVQHYQTLYQKRVARDLETDQSEKIQQLVAKNNLYQQKINDLETSLLNLAKNKLKGKKEASELLKKLETNWKKSKAHWQQEKTNLITTYQQEQEQQASNLAQERKKFYEKIESKDKKIKEMEEWSKGQHNQIVKLETNHQNLLNKLDKYLAKL